MPTYFLNNNSGSEIVASLERRIAEVVPNLIRIAKIEEITRDNITGLSYMLVVGPSDNEDYLNPLIDVAAQNRNRFFFILISEGISTANYKRLVRTGGADWVSAATAPEEIVEILARRPTASSVAPPTEMHRVPVTITFVPSAGGVGNTTLLTEVGVQLRSLKAMKDRNICLVDLDFQTSHLCDHLDIEPRLQIHEILDDPGRLDTQLFDIFVSRHSSGLDVFAAPRSKYNICDVDVAALDALFDMIAQRYHFILIDLPVTWFGWTRDVIANSSAVLVTGINTIPCLRQISDTLVSVRASRPETNPIGIVVNRCERRIFGVARRNHVTSVLKDEMIFFVRSDERAMIEGGNAGIPVSFTGTRKSVKDIAAITSFCAKVNPAAALVPSATLSQRFGVNVG